MARRLRGCEPPGATPSPIWYSPHPDAPSRAEEASSLSPPTAGALASATFRGAPAGAQALVSAPPRHHRGLWRGYRHLFHPAAGALRDRDPDRDRLAPERPGALRDHPPRQPAHDGADLLPGVSGGGRAAGGRAGELLVPPELGLAAERPRAHVAAVPHRLHGLLLGSRRPRLGL